jgi:starch synthase (maltosyl-transferring)
MRRPRARQDAVDDSSRTRVVIEHVRPQIDCGRFPIKRTRGDMVTVTAQIHADGHDVLRAMLRHRRVPGSAPNQPVDGTRNGWRETPMEPLDNDEWRGSFQVDELGQHEYCVSAWVDRFASWRHDVEVKNGAGQDVSSELVEGAQLIRAAAARIAKTRGRSKAPRRARRGRGEGGDDDASWLRDRADAIGGAADETVRVQAALDDRLREHMSRHDDRPGAVSSAPLGVTVDRERARFGAWYEMFPRSAGTDPTRSATFREAEARLRDIADMGFDVVYLPPIHPIGRSVRKGPNNRIAAETRDPGSPWAIGSEAGGHTAIEPGLGTLDDFDRFVATALRSNLEVALDLAFQASPDHPYVKEHPEWFRHRPDGSIKHAENPPKKYQDIYPFDFESPASAALWAELKAVVMFWIDRRVQIFRVDNPHTKPYRFWEWLIRAVRSAHPEVIFLSEAFSRPTVMRYLAKLGFSQSYTYFTWRNTKSELTDYFNEVTETEMREYFRPNLFANTPDILHAYLQHGGRPAFQVRLVLAATLGASYGIYSGFELCENEAVPGTEEYLNSEKYQYRPRDWDRPGHIKDLIRVVNRIRREHRALQFDDGLQFFQTDNPNLIFYGKTPPGGGDTILVVVNLDPRSMQHGWVQVPLAALGLPANETYEVQDLLDGEHYTWRGEWNYVRLDPGIRPAHILKLTSERTFTGRGRGSCRPSRR